MPRHYRNLIYYSEDWDVMESALLKAIRKLQKAQGHEDIDPLARRVMALFNEGLRDAAAIARAAAIRKS